MTRHMFAGALTPAGFMDFFDDIMPIQQANTRYFLKGASGGGKSTFMKHIAADLIKKGIAADHFHCANDVASLDAVAAHSLGLCIMDATAPHSHDPQLPIITDSIIDFAQFLDKSKLKGHKSTIQDLMDDKKALLARAMGYYAAAGKVHNAEIAAAETALKQQELENLANSAACRGGSQPPAIAGRLNRRLFLSAITPEGPISLADNAFDNCKVYAIHTEEQIGTRRLLAHIMQATNAAGLATESFYNPLNLAQIDYLHIPDKNLAYVTTSGVFGYNGKVDERIDLARCINPAMLTRAKINMESDHELLNTLLDQTTQLLNAAKSIHNKVEEIYIQAMDFDRLDEMTKNFVDCLLRDKPLS